MAIKYLKIGKNLNVSDFYESTKGWNFIALLRGVAIKYLKIGKTLNVSDFYDYRLKDVIL